MATREQAIQVFDYLQKNSKNFDEVKTQFNALDASRQSAFIDQLLPTVSQPTEPEEKINPVASMARSFFDTATLEQGAEIYSAATSLGAEVKPGYETTDDFERLLAASREQNPTASFIGSALGFIPGLAERTVLKVATKVAPKTTARMIQAVSKLAKSGSMTAKTTAAAVKGTAKAGAYEGASTVLEEDKSVEQAASNTAFSGAIEGAFPAASAAAKISFASGRKLLQAAADSKTLEPAIAYVKENIDKIASMSRTQAKEAYQQSKQQLKDFLSTASETTKSVSDDLSNAIQQVRNGISDKLDESAETIKQTLDSSLGTLNEIFVQSKKSLSAAYGEQITNIAGKTAGKTADFSESVDELVNAFAKEGKITLSTDGLITKKTASMDASLFDYLKQLQTNSKSMSFEQVNGLKSVLGNATDFANINVNSLNQAQFNTWQLLRNSIPEKFPEIADDFNTISNEYATSKKVVDSLAKMGSKDGIDSTAKQLTKVISGAEKFGISTKSVGVVAKVTKLLENQLLPVFNEKQVDFINKEIGKFQELADIKKMRKFVATDKNFNSLLTNESVDASQDSIRKSIKSRFQETSELFNMRRDMDELGTLPPKLRRGINSPEDKKAVEESFEYLKKFMPKNIPAYRRLLEKAKQLDQAVKLPEERRFAYDLALERGFIDESTLNKLVFLETNIPEFKTLINQKNALEFTNSFLTEESEKLGRLGVLKSRGLRLLASGATAVATSGTGNVVDGIIAAATLADIISNPTAYELLLARSKQNLKASMGPKVQKALRVIQEDIIPAASVAGQQGQTNATEQP